ncbi:MAG: hypothetical protein Q8862_14130, partial [Bacteroidota bacterium]|nr:hypothetical protein [Bacteroidota bacterium]
QILDAFDSVMTHSTQGIELVKSHYQFINKKIRSQEIQIVYGKSLPNSFIGGAGVHISADSTKIGLVVGDFLLDVYSTNPTLAMGMLMYEYQNMYDFYNNRKLYLISLSNMIEQTYFSVDALVVEAMFLKSYFGDSSSLSPLEKYIINDLNYNMNGAVFLLYNTDLNLLHSMSNLAHSNKNLEETLEEFKVMGNVLIENKKFEADKADWDKYCDLVSLRTYVYFSSQVVFDILKMKGKKNITPSTFKLRDYKDVYQIVNAIKPIIDRNSKYFKVGTGILDKYNKSFQIQKD